MAVEGLVQEDTMFATLNLPLPFVGLKQSFDGSSDCAILAFCDNIP